MTLTITTSSSSPKRTAGGGVAKSGKNKRKLVVYRAAVGVLGLVLMALGVVSGPLPGPGGIPLVLLGLAVWSSEFEWAHQVMLRLKKELHRYRSWPASRRMLFWVAFFAAAGSSDMPTCSTLGFPGGCPDPPMTSAAPSWFIIAGLHRGPEGTMRQ